MPINKTTFYIGEIIKIYGTISPVPQNNNIQLASWYYCPASQDYWRADDLWTTCNSSGYFEFNFPAYIGEPSPGYCKVTTSQNWMAMVRYQKVIGEPPDTFESLNWTVLNQQFVKKQSLLEVYASPISGTVPLNVYIQGNLLDRSTQVGLPNRTVRVYMDGSLIKTVTTDDIGHFGFSYTINTTGIHSIYAEWDGDDQYEGC